MIKSTTIDYSEDKLPTAKFLLMPEPDSSRRVVLQTPSKKPELINVKDQ
jgi:hypothetical protein